MDKDSFVDRKNRMQEKIPQGRKEAILHKLHKKRTNYHWQNYKNIALLNVAYNILTTIMKNKLAQKQEEETAEYQCEFRKNRLVLNRGYSYFKDSER